jgi:hypothetical protein
VIFGEDFWRCEWLARGWRTELGDAWKNGYFVQMTVREKGGEVFREAKCCGCAPVSSKSRGSDCFWWRS